MNTRRNFACALVLLLTTTGVTPMLSQSIATGEITGVVTDPSGAVIPNATATLMSDEDGATRTQMTTSTGGYRFAFVAPGGYTLTITASKYHPAKSIVVIRVAQTISMNVQLVIAAQPGAITVRGEGLVEAGNADLSTTFSNDLIAMVPNPGNDLTYAAQTAPGAVMDTQSGYGSFSTFGLPATSNNFIYNGMSEVDPILTINNSGATDLLLGLNDIREVTVVNNGYSGQYGGLAGAQVSYVSKPGTNKLHGNAIYWWNGRVLNANNYFNNQQNPPSPRPFVNANQWATSFGGPIKKDKTFFFIDFEGLRLAIPTVSMVKVPSPQFEQATLANISAKKSSELPFYQTMFRLYNNAPGAKSAADALKNGGCTDFTGTMGFGIPAGPPCALQFNSAVNSKSNEWLLTARVDQTIGSNDRAFIHFRTDHGLQATLTDQINTLFNVTSPQPQYEGQLNETHAFNSSTVNAVTLSGSYYRSIFVQPNRNEMLSVLPEQIAFAGDSFERLGTHQLPFATPQGRNGSQYQVVDDFTHTRGRHTLSTGVNFIRNNTTDYDAGENSAPASVSETLTDFFNGTASVLQQNFPTRLSQPLATYSFGAYVQDEWRPRNNLMLMLAVRADRYSNPTCRTNCFSRLSHPFSEISHDPDQPYAEVIETGRAQALPSLDEIALQPRFGFAWTPFGPSSNTVVRGGIGLFSDSSGIGLLATSLMNNFPNNPQFIVSGPFALAPNVPNSAASVASTANQVFQAQFPAGGTLNSITKAITAEGGSFFGPSFANVASKFHYPRFQEWSLELQQALGQKMSFSVMYVGNHGIHEGLANAALNAFCDAACLGPNGLSTSALSFLGLPSSAPDSRFGTVTETQRVGVSNYNGVTVALARKFSSLQFQANYTWSHALDTLSNNGIADEPFNFNTNLSITYPQQPLTGKRALYGNADYDVRQNLSLNYVWTGPEKFGPHSLLGGWIISGTVFAHTGLPLTIIDTSTTGVLAGFNYGASVFANQLESGPFGCGESAAKTNTPCPEMIRSFASPVSTSSASFGNQRRNQVYGPKYFDTDIALTKNFKLPKLEGVKFAVGAQFFNVFNHPNFDQPVQDVADSNFGRITKTVSPPTSIFGAFLGGDASPRVI